MAETLTLDGELDRQLRAVRKGETDVVVCPWHGNIVNSETGNCCIEMDEARERLASAHLRSIEKQADRARHGGRKSIECPYCGEINHPNNLESRAHWKRPNVNPYCCESFFVAVVRLAEHAKVQKQVDHARRIQDNVARASRN